MNSRAVAVTFRNSLLYTVADKGIGGNHILAHALTGLVFRIERKVYVVVLRA